jgi:predicted ATPase/DNA-binding SARP family transcriptional activator
MAALSLSFLGPWEALRPDSSEAELGYDKVRALLAFLAVESGRPHSRETLIGLLWPELPQQAARNNLRQALHTLREAIGDRAAAPPFLDITRTSIQFNRESDYALDVDTFASAVTSSDRHVHRSAATCHTCARQLVQAAALYRGPFLAEFFLSDSVAFEEWVVLKREWLSQLMLRALDRLVAFYERRGHYEEALRHTQRLLELEPWREAAHRQVMRLQLLRGNRNAALVQYETCRSLLAEELGVNPEAATTLLYEQIQDEVDNVARVVETVNVPASPPYRVPLPPTPFVGRQAEMERIAALIESPDTRLLTLSGPGGVGKTRLALQAAADQRNNFADGVYFVNLAPLQTADLLAQAMADAVGSEPGTAQEPAARLLDQLRQKEMLIVLDNFEHLLVGADLLNDVLRAAPETMLLVTSRQRLNLQAEWVFPVEGFAVAPPAEAWEAVAESDAIQFFAQSALRAHPEFALSPDNAGSVAHICHLVGGLPLAIELAASWTRILSCAEIAAEIEANRGFLRSWLRDVPERQRSLWAVFDHSWALLTAEEQGVLRRLAVFQGDFDRAAAEQVAGASLLVLAALSDKSLLQRHPSGRYKLHSLLQEYALEKLSGNGGIEETQARHFHYYLDLAQTAERALSGPDKVRWLDRLTVENDNLRAALAWSVASGATEPGARLTVALYRFWYWRSHFVEGRRWLETFLAAEGAPPADLRAELLYCAGVLTAEQDDYAQAEAHLRESLSVRRALGDVRGQAACLNSLGIIAWSQEAYDRATELLEQSVALRRVAGDPNLGPPLNNLGLIALAREDYVQAERYFAEQLAWAQVNENDWGIAISQSNLGAAVLEQARVDEACACFVDSLRLYRKLGDQEGTAWCLEGLARVAISRERAELAAHLCGAASILRERINAPLNPAERPRYERTVAAARAMLGEPEFKAAWSKGQEMSLEQTAALAGMRLAQ